MKRRKPLMVGLLCFLWCALPVGRPVSGQKANPEFFPVSVWYSGGKARAPMLSEIGPQSEDEWRKDLRQIKSLGFNTVRTWIEWTAGEPQPGRYRLENLKLLGRLAQEEGLKVIVQLYVDSAPDWVGKKYPEGRYEAQSGDKVSSQSAPGFCADHSGVREAVLSFIGEAARAAVSLPNLYAWDLWSEPHIVNWAYINYVPNVQFCYCPATRARFRTWLQAKYGNLSQLNQAWYRHFESWEDVDPPRFGTILSYTDHIDWKNFLYQKMAEDLRLRYQAVRREDKSHLITSHAAVPSIFYTPYNGYGATDDFLMAEQVDYYGTSLYPKHNHPSKHWEAWRFMIAVDFARSANRKNGGFYVGELQAGHGTIGLDIGDPVTPEDHRLWIWSVLAKGAKAVNLYAYYPMSSGYESGGYGLVDLDGALTSRAVETGKIARSIDRKQELFLKSKAWPAQIAIVYNPLAQMVGGEQRGNTTDMHQLSLIGYYRAFAESNIPVDFVHRRDLENDALGAYKLVILPYPLMLSEKASRGIERFVAQGGHFVTEARAAWNDERGFAAPIIPGMGLHSVFGASESSLRMKEEIRLKISSTAGHPALTDLQAGDLLKGVYFQESLAPDADGESQTLAVFEDSTPAIVAHRYGRGETLLIGSFFGMACHPRCEPNNRRFLLNLLRWADIERPILNAAEDSTAFAVEARLQQNSDGQLLFLLNHHAHREEVDLRLRCGEGAFYALTEIVGGATQNLQPAQGRLRLATVLAANEAQVWEISAAKSASP